MDSQQRRSDYDISLGTLPPLTSGKTTDPVENESDQSDNNSSLLADDDSESVEENDEEEEESSSEHELPEDPVVYDLRHRTSYETARKRRRRHLANRVRGQAPSLYFTGTHKTDYWHGYGIEPDSDVPTGSIQGVDTVFTKDELKKLGPIERRIHINGQKFKIQSNREFSGNMYRAIALAVGLPEKEHAQVEARIFSEMSEHWPLYQRDICKYCGSLLATFDPLIHSPNRMIEKYRKARRLAVEGNSESAPPEFELIAAANQFRFSFAIVELTSMEASHLQVRNCKDGRVLQNALTKYHFLKTGTYLHTLCYEFLLPIGPPKRIHDGEYPPVLRDVILVERARPWRTSSSFGDQASNPITRFKPALGPIPVAFGLDHRVFLHRSTISHDLWSLLAELMFKRLNRAPLIKHTVVESKHDFVLYYLACKAKKRFQVSGAASIEKIADEFSRRFSTDNPRGDLEDLVQAAGVFEFSCTVIGMDVCGNFHWRDYVSAQEADKGNAPYFAFFAKTMPNRMVFWYALEDLGRKCPKERKLYQEAQFGDLRKWNGRFYFHFTPPLSLLTEGGHKGEPLSLLTVPTRLLSHATGWASTKLRSTVKAAVSTASVITTTLTQRFFGIFGWMKSRRRVAPDKTVQALFVREKP